MKGLRNLMAVATIVGGMWSCSDAANEPGSWRFEEPVDQPGEVLPPTGPGVEVPPPPVEVPPVEPVVDPPERPVETIATPVLYVDRRVDRVILPHEIDDGPRFYVGLDRCSLLSNQLFNRYAHDQVWDPINYDRETSFAVFPDPSGLQGRVEAFTMRGQLSEEGMFGNMGVATHQVTIASSDHSPCQTFEAIGLCAIPKEDMQCTEANWALFNRVGMETPDRVSMELAELRGGDDWVGLNVAYHTEVADGAVEIGVRVYLPETEPGAGPQEIYDLRELKVRADVRLYGVALDETVLTEVDEGYLILDRRNNVGHLAATLRDGDRQLRVWGAHQLEQLDGAIVGGGMNADGASGL